MLEQQKTNISAQAFDIELHFDAFSCSDEAKSDICSSSSVLIICQLQFKIYFKKEIVVQVIFSRMYSVLVLQISP